MVIGSPTERGVEEAELTDGECLEGLSVAELALALPVDGGHPHLVRGVGLQTRQHHRRCTQSGYWVIEQPGRGSGAVGLASCF